jgi:hypothetical protein
MPKAALVLPVPGGPVEVEDAAALLRLDAAQVPDAVQVSTNFQRSQAGVDVRLHFRMQDHLVEIVTRHRLHQPCRRLNKSFISQEP